MSFVEVKDLSIREKKKTILEKVTLTFHKGKIYGLLGPNGAGKTTLLKSLLGVFQPSSGSIFIDGVNLYETNKTPLPFSIGSLIEYPGFYENLSITENLHLHLSYLNKDRSEDSVHRLLEEVGLLEYKETLLSQTSLGMKQRLGLARAMAHSPHLLLLDEPTNGLDPYGIKDVRELLKERAQCQQTIVVSSHHLSEIEQIADVLLFMNRGRIIFRTENNGEPVFLHTMHKNSAGDEEFPIKVGGNILKETNTFMEWISSQSKEEVEHQLQEQQGFVPSIQSKELSLEDLYLTLLKEDRTR